ncbi:hypothetical protein D3C84_1245660 [compost metagenome]
MRIGLVEIVVAQEHGFSLEIIADVSPTKRPFIRTAHMEGNLLKTAAMNGNSQKR